MDHVSYTDLRQNLKKHLDKVCDDRAPLVVTRRNGEAVVMLALSEYESLEETLHLLGDPANAEHLRRSMAQAEAGEFIEFDPEQDSAKLAGEQAPKKRKLRVAAHE
jgi:antitoxin YefM